MIKEVISEVVGVGKVMGAELGQVPVSPRSIVSQGIGQDLVASPHGGGGYCVGGDDLVPHVDNSEIEGQKYLAEEAYDDRLWFDDPELQFGKDLPTPALLGPVEIQLLTVMEYLDTSDEPRDLLTAAIKFIHSRPLGDFTYGLGYSKLNSRDKLRLKVLHWERLSDDHMDIQYILKEPTCRTVLGDETVDRLIEEAIRRSGTQSEGKARRYLKMFESICRTVGKADGLEVPAAEIAGAIEKVISQENLSPEESSEYRHRFSRIIDHHLRAA